MRIFLFLIFISVLTITAQETVYPIVISEDISDSSVIKQKSPKLFNDTDKGFIVSWIDYRNGDPQYFGQMYTESLKKVGKNFRTPTNKYIHYLANDRSLAIDQKTVIDWNDGIGFFDYNGYLFNNSFTSEQLNIGNYDYTFAVDSWDSRNSSSVKFNNNFISVTDYSERLKIKKINKETLETTTIFDKYVYMHFKNSSVAINNKGEYVVAYLNTSYNDTTDGLFIKSFSNMDSIIVTKKIKSGNYKRKHPELIILADNDSLFNLFSFNLRTLTNTKLDTHGKIIYEKSYEVFDGISDQYYSNGKLNISNIINNKRLLTVNTLNPNLTALY